MAFTLKAASSEPFQKFFWVLVTWWRCPMGLVILSTRTIRDLTPKQPAITAIPEIRVQMRSSRDWYLILACDGIWDIMTDSEVGNFVVQQANKLVAADEADVLPKVVDLAFAGGMSGTGIERLGSNNNILTLASYCWCNDSCDLSSRNVRCPQIGITRCVLIVSSFLVDNVFISVVNCLLAQLILWFSVL